MYFDLVEVIENIQNENMYPITLTDMKAPM